MGSRLSVRLNGSFNRKAEPFKLWLAQITSERLDEMQDSVWDRKVRKEN